MPVRLRDIAAAVVLTASAALTFAQQTPPPGPQPSHVPSKQAAADPMAAVLAKADAAARKAEQDASAQDSVSPIASDPRYVKAFTDFQIWNLHHLETTYAWHHVCSIIIFFVVIFLVMSGVWFSWMQFRLAHRYPLDGVRRTVSSASTNAAPGAAEDPAAVATEEKEMVTEFSASPAGVKVASSAIGVVILVISLCFFYLYLDKVYPITLSPNQWTAQPPPASK